MKEMARIRFLVAAVVLLSVVSSAFACSCMPQHPQQKYCQSDFVLLGRIKREYVFNDTVAYKIRIRKEFKMSEKAHVSLKSGRVLTAGFGSLCGVQLEVGKKYILGGKIHSLRPWISLCGLHMDWDVLTPRQKKGFNKMYKLGCQCNVHVCWKNRCGRKVNSCSWSNKCQTDHGFCLPKSNSKCEWVKNKAQRECRSTERGKSLF